jgi:hypothetical protein
VPQPGHSWEPVGKARTQPHDYERNGTAKRLTLVRPATGAVRATGVTTATNAILHPWLTAELEQVLDTLPAVTLPEGERPPGAPAGSARRWRAGRPGWAAPGSPPTARCRRCG